MLRELIAAFDIDTGRAVQALKSIDGAISGASGKLGGLLDAFAGSAMVHGFGEFVSGQIEAGSRVNDLSEKLGVGTDALQAFQLAAGLAGVDSENAAQALGLLNKHLGDAIDGNAEAAATFAGLGVDLGAVKSGAKSALDLVPDLADKFAELGSDAQRTALAMKLFGKSGAALLPFLKGGREEASKMLAEFDRLGGGMSAGFVKAADAAGDEIDKVKFGLRSWKSQLVFAVLPTVTLLATRLQGWVAKLIKLTKETNLAKVIMIAFGAASAAASLKAAAGFAKMLGFLPKGGGIWRTLLGLGEIGIMIALVAAAVLIFEDLWTMMNGGESVIGDLVTKFLGIDEANKLVAELWQGWDQVKGSVSALGPPLADLAKWLLEIGIKAMPYVVSSFVFLVKIIGSAVTLLAGFVETLAKLGEVATGKAGWGDVGKVIDRAGNAVFGKGGFFGDPGRAMQSFDRDAPGTTIRQPTSMTANGHPVVVNQTNQVTNNIQGVKDANAAGVAAKNGTKDALGGELADAMASYGGG